MKFRVSFIFSYGQAGWSEQWYRDADTPQIAANIQDIHWQAYCYPRSDGTILRAIRANRVDQPRVTFLRVMNRVVGTPLHNAALGGEPPAVALHCYAACADFRHRTAMFRGMNDLDVERNIAGEPVWNGGIISDVNALKLALLGFGAQIQALRLATIGNPDRVVTQLAGGGANAEVTAVQYAGDPIPVGSRVIFHGLNRGQFPGFGSAVPVIGATNTTITVPVMWRQNAATAPVQGVKVRVAEYDYPAVQDLMPRDVRTRKVGRPSLGYRGRRTATRYRQR